MRAQKLSCANTSDDQAPVVPVEVDREEQNVLALKVNVGAPPSYSFKPLGSVPLVSTRDESGEDTYRTVRVRQKAAAHG